MIAQLLDVFCLVYPYPSSFLPILLPITVVQSSFLVQNVSFANSYGKSSEMNELVVKGGLNRQCTALPMCLISCLFLFENWRADIYFLTISFFSAATTKLILESVGAALGSICMPMLVRVFPVSGRVSGGPRDNK